MIYVQLAIYYILANKNDNKNMKRKYVNVDPTNSGITNKGRD